MRKRARFSLLAGLLPLFAVSANAAPLLFKFTGQYSGYTSLGRFIACDVCPKVFGSYQYDPDIPDTDPSPIRAAYRAKFVEFTIPDVVSFSTRDGLINVVNNGWIGLEGSPPPPTGILDLYSLHASGNSIASPFGFPFTSPSTLTVILLDPTALALSSDAVPQAASTFTSLLPGQFQLFLEEDDDDTFFIDYGFFGTVESVSISEVGEVVPEPSSAAFLALGISALFVRRYVC